MSIEFQPWPKIARLNREITITEKIDGTNAAVIVTEEGEVAAQSRKNLITPEAEPLKEGDWVQVWAQVHEFKSESLASVEIKMRHGNTFEVVPHPDAIVRPSAGQAPPWVKPIEEPTADYAIVRDGFRTYVRMPADQLSLPNRSTPWALAGGDIHVKWEDLGERVVVSGGAS